MKKRGEEAKLRAEEERKARLAELKVAAVATYSTRKPRRSTFLAAKKIPWLRSIYLATKNILGLI
jgi:hypothetical protein